MDLTCCSYLAAPSKLNYSCLLGGHEKLASETGLTGEQVYNWFANYQKHQKVPLQHVPRTHETTSEIHRAKECGSDPLQFLGYIPESVLVSRQSGEHLKSFLGHDF